MVNGVFHAASCASCSCCYIANGFLFEDEWRAILRRKFGFEYVAQEVGFAFILRTGLHRLLHLRFGILDSVQLG